MVLINLLLWYQATTCSILEFLNLRSNFVKQALWCSFIFFNIATFSLLVSGGLYGSIYYINKPRIYHSVPLKFNYKRSCIEDHHLYKMGRKYNYYPYKGNCYPTAVLPLSNSQQAFLDEGVQYTVSIRLELPETPSNMEMGMFMIEMHVFGKDDNDGDGGYWSSLKQKHHGKQPRSTQLTSSISTSMRYNSPMIQNLRLAMLWPLYLMDMKHESQVIDEILYEDLYLDKLRLNWTTEITIDNPAIQLYSAHLHISAKFNGLQHFFYNWPLISFLLGTCSIFIPVFIAISIITWICVKKIIYRERSGIDTSDVATDDHERLSEIEEEEADRNRLEEVGPDQKIEDSVDDVTREEEHVIRSRSSSASSSSIEMISSQHLTTSSSNGTLSKSWETEKSSWPPTQLETAEDDDDQELRRRNIPSQDQ